MNSAHTSPSRQEAKSAATRQRILDATFEALHEVGYARTTTSEVCRRAEVARGTLLHHFATTSDLVTAAADDIFHRRLASYREAFDALPRTDRVGGEALGLLWGILSGPTYYAWLEIVVAARTDEVLRESVRAVMARFGAAVETSFKQMFPSSDSLPFEGSLVPGIVFPLLHGLAIDRIYAEPKRIDEIVSTLRRLADFAEGLAYPQEVSS